MTSRPHLWPPTLYQQQLLGTCYVDIFHLNLINLTFERWSQAHLTKKLDLKATYSQFEDIFYTVALVFEWLGSLATSVIPHALILAPVTQ